MGRTSAKGRRNGVRRTRLAAELTQAELAAGVGVTRQTVAAVEAGDYAPSVYLALAIARHLGSTVEDLFDADATSADQTGPVPTDSTPNSASHSFHSFPAPAPVPAPTKGR